MLHIGQRTYACIVDQYVNSAELLHNRVKNLLAIAKDRDICLNRESITTQAAKLCRGSFGLIAMDIHNRNIGTALGKAQGDSLPNPICAAGDNNLCVFKVSKYMRFSFLHQNYRLLFQEVLMAQHFLFHFSDQGWGLMPEARRWILGTAAT